MSKIKGIPDATNAPNWQELRRYVASGLLLICDQVNGRLSFQDNLAMAGPYTVSFPQANVLVQLRHNLGRVPQGFSEISRNAALILYAPDANPWTSDTIFLKSSAVGTATLYLL